MLELYLGGARSGKSALAEQRAESSGLQPVCIATATAGDAEMTARIARHRDQRGPRWRTVEEPLQLAAVLQREAAPDRCLVVDCLTLWLTNLLLCDAPDAWREQRAALLRVLPGLPGIIVMVSNETGLGVVPADPLSRRFVDESGRLHQQLAAVCERVVWIAAGLPQLLKGPALEDALP